VDFDEVSIAREIHRDASSEYFLNGSPVRLKDVIELLASVHIGASGHHIISQGEADRILNSSPRDRRAMIEDALGLKVYHWKIAESEKKLVKTEENMRQSESLRREIAPHIKFLKKQVEKVEQARSLRDELANLYGEYLKREEVYIKHTQEGLRAEKAMLEHELRSTNEALAKAESLRGNNSGQSPEAVALLDARGQLGGIRRERDDLGRKIGRLEGMIEMETRRLHAPVESADKMISAHESESLAQGLYEELGYAESSEDYLYIKGVVSKARARVGQFLEHMRGNTSTHVQDEKNAQERHSRRKW
jgi:chromosome segregation protein